MKLVSTRESAPLSSFKQAVSRGMAPDGGLYMPVRVPQLKPDFWSGLREQSIPAIAEALFNELIGDEFEEGYFGELAREAFNFDAPVVPLDDRTGVLELFHGPTLAFKDFGARFMARVMPLCKVSTNGEPLTVLTATSGDTGAAVAQGFYKVDGVRAFILYPKGKVSPLQERQFATLGHNITAVEVDGTFDDCQRIVKEVFAQDNLNKRFNLTSANSINIARLIPQMVYYVAAWAELTRDDIYRKLTFIVPSGNFGNVTAGVMAAHMGMPNVQYVTATNANDVVPEFLEGNAYTPRPSVATISNAMDVGSPSNFERLEALYGGNHAALRNFLKGDRVSDARTREVIREVYEQFNYAACPHTATGIEVWNRFKSLQRYESDYGVVLATAHPAKFIEVMEQELPGAVAIPERLAILRDKELKSIPIAAAADELIALL
ncbi:MAG: threonine synthase [Bacteroidetes bacterium]|nr:threonine synthase [Bacteroidota bacterium]